MAISRLETGHWTSKIFKDNNNFGGMLGEDGWMSFATRIEGAEAFIEMLEVYYFGQGLNTIEKIQPKYCPDGGSTWINSVKEIMNDDYS